MSITNIYCLFRFFSDSEKFELSDFSDHLEIDKTSSWALGDLKDNTTNNFRLTSSAVIKSKVSDDFDGEQLIIEFIDYLISKKECILSLKQKYTAETFFEIVINLESEDKPVVILNNKQLEFLSLTTTRLDYVIYDYRE